MAEQVKPKTLTLAEQAAAHASNSSASDTDKLIVALLTEISARLAALSGGK